MTENDVRNQNRFVAWLAAWGLSFVVASFALRAGWVSGSAKWLVAFLPTAIGAAAIWSYVVFIREADELLRKIHYEAIALAFGAGMVFMLGYGLWERAGAPKLDVSDPLLIMSLVWSFSVVVLTRRYS